MKLFYIVILCLCMTATGFAQTKQGKCELLGHVTDEITGKHLPYVNIYVKGTPIGTSSDESGHFLLTQLPEGKITVVAKLMRYKTIEKEVELSSEKTNEIMFVMQEEAVAMDEVVVSANRYEVSRKKASAVVNVLTPMVLENTNSNTLSEGLCFMTGLRIENNCQNCGTQQVRINGLDGQYSQILIDNRPIVSALTGVYGLEQIPAGMIERVEVLRGGGSALYGSNSIAGTINIITKEPLSNSGQLSSNLTLIGGKSADMNTNLNASLISKDYKTGAYLFSNMNQRNPFDANGDGYTELPELRGSTVGFRGFYKSSDFSKLTAEYHNITEHRRGGNAMDLPPHEADISEQLNHEINGGSLKYDIFSHNYKQKISLYTSAQYTHRKSFYGGNDSSRPEGQTAYGGYGKTTDMTFDAGGHYSYSFDKLWFMPANLTTGIEYGYDNLADQTPAYKRDITQTIHTESLFMQNEWKNDKSSFLLGGRLDKHNLINKPIFSPRVSMRYSPDKDYAFRASYSTGFLAPQAFSEDLHVDAAAGTLVLIKLSPDLKPERSTSYNLSADLYHTFGSVLTNLFVEGFYTTLYKVFVLEDIGIDANKNIIKEKRNGSGATVMGINLEGKAMFGKNTQLQAGFTIQDSKYKQPETWSDKAETTQNMLRTPDIYGYFTGTYTGIKNLSLAFSGTYTGSMYVPHLAGYITKDVLKETASFFDANFKIAYAFTLQGNLKLQVNAGIQNIFDNYQNDFDKGAKRDAGYVYGPVSPRSYFAGIKLML